MTAYYQPRSNKQQEEMIKDAEEEKIKGYRLHPEILKAYRENKYILDWLPNASQENEKTFWEQVEQSGKEVKHEITQIFRISPGIGRNEFFFYHEELKSNNKLGAPIHFFHTVGKLEKPNFIPSYNSDTGEVIGSEIDSTETIYELEWKKDWNEELEAQIIDNANFVVISGHVHYGGFEYEDFKNRTFPELVTFGRYGTFEPTGKIIKIEDQRRVEKDKEKRQRLK